MIEIKRKYQGVCFSGERVLGVLQRLQYQMLEEVKESSDSRGDHASTY